MWALENPNQVRAAGVLLGHADPKTVERHYNQANLIVPSRSLASIVTRRDEMFR